MSDVGSCAIISVLDVETPWRIVAQTQNTAFKRILNNRTEFVITCTTHCMRCAALRCAVDTQTREESLVIIAGAIHQYRSLLSSDGLMYLTFHLHTTTD